MSEQVTPFSLHPQLANDCFELADLPLCKLLLCNDSAYPWFILVPKVADVSVVAIILPVPKAKPEKSGDSTNPHELTPEQLRWKCNLDIIPFETTAEVDPAHGVVGQPTALEALKFGLQCLARGQNVYVRGARGTGRMRMVRRETR